MIKIGNKVYRAEQAIEIHYQNTVPTQPVEEGFDVQDHIRKEPIQVRVDVIIFDDDAEWDSRLQEWRDGGKSAAGARELMSTPRYDSTYQYLIDMRNSGEVFLLDCSEYARQTPMIYPNMVISSTSQLVQHGEIYRCTVLFTQITKNVVATEKLFVHEVDTAGDPTILWNKEPFEPVNTEVLTPVHESSVVPYVLSTLYPAPIIVGKVVHAALNFASGIMKNGLSETINDWQYGSRKTAEWE